MKEKVKDTVRLGIEFSTFDGRVLLGLDGLGLRPLVQRHLAMGTRGGVWQCHITPDLLLVYLIEKDVLVLTLTRTGTHSDLFGK